MLDSRRESATFPNTIDAINARRAIKHYDPAHRMTDAEIRQLMESAMQAPSAFNIQNCRFVTVLDPEVRQQIRAAAWDQAQVTEASLLIVMCADKDAWKKDAARYWKNAPQPVQVFLVSAITPRARSAGSGGDSALLCSAVAAPPKRRLPDAREARRRWQWTLRHAQPPGGV